MVSASNSKNSRYGFLLAMAACCVSALSGCGLRDAPEMETPAGTPQVIVGETIAPTAAPEAEGTVPEETAPEEAALEETAPAEIFEAGREESLEMTLQEAEIDKEAETVKESETAEEPAETGITITISAAGDCSLGNYLGQEYEWSFDQTYAQVQDAGYFLQNVFDIFSTDDMTIVNLEGVLTSSDQPAEGRTYNIKGDPSYVEILKLGSVEAVSMGNNHRQDFGAEGTEDTVAALQDAGIVYAYDQYVGIYEVKGLRIGFVSVNETTWGKDSERFLKDGFAKLREQEADLIIACCHWGVEGDAYPEEYQQTLGRLCIDWGADLVLGCHPHVLQGIEEYQGKFIVYSLANFCFGANRNPSNKDTMIFQQTFTFIDGEKQEDQNIRVIPCFVSSVTTRNDYRPTPQEGEAASRIIEKLNDYSGVYGVTFAEDGTLVRPESE